MIKSLAVFSLWLLPVFCYAQNDNISVYLHNGHGFKSILLLGNKTGYSYSGPHLFTDEVFTYQYYGSNLIRTFDPEYSLKYRTDTLKVEGKDRLRSQDGVRFRRVNAKTQTRLLKNYILPSADAGYYRVFLEKHQNR